jgi:hypothetical protein
VKPIIGIASNQLENLPAGIPTEETETPADKDAIKRELLYMIFL